MQLPLALFICLGAIFIIAGVGLRSFRTQALWLRRMAIGKAVRAFAQARQNKPTASKALQDGVEPSDITDLQDLHLIMEIWRHAVWTIYISKANVHDFQIFNAAGEAGRFVDFADAELCVLLEAAVKVMKNEHLSFLVFSGLTWRDDALLKRIQRYRDHYNAHLNLNAVSDTVVHRIGAENA